MELRESFQDAIARQDFSLARDEAFDLHRLAIASASLLETAGEQHLATVQADIALQDRLDTIDTGLQDVLNDELEELRRQTELQQQIRDSVERSDDRARRLIGEGLAGTVEGNQIQSLLTDLERRRDREFVRSYYLDQRYGLTDNQRTFLDQGTENAFSQGFASIADRYFNQFFAGGTPVQEELDMGTGFGRQSITYGDINISVNPQGSILSDNDLARFVEEAVRQALANRQVQVNG